MVSFIAARLLRIAIVACAVVTVIFFLFKAVPGDQAALIAGPGATQSEIDAMRHQLGLDRPVITQYLDYMTGLLQGDFGHPLCSSAKRRSRANTISAFAVPSAFAM